MKRTEHREEKYEFPFVSYTPENMSEKLPLIVQLHGAGERGDGSDLSLMDVHGFSKIMDKEEYGCIFVMPQCPSDTFWAAKVESIISFIEKIIKDYPVDEHRVYLTGISMGGYGTWFTAMAKPQLFAAIAPVCGGGMAWNAGVLDMPVWAFHGSADMTVNVRNTDEMVEKLKALGRDVTYTRAEGVGHNVWNLTYFKELIDWFLEKRR